MLTTVIAIVSGALVAFGVMALIRDRTRRDRQKLVTARQRNLHGAADLADVTITSRDANRPPLPTARLGEPAATAITRPIADVAIVKPAAQPQPKPPAPSIQTIDKTAGIADPDRATSALPSGPETSWPRAPMTGPDEPQPGAAPSVDAAPKSPASPSTRLPAHQQGEDVAEAAQSQPPRGPAAMDVTNLPNGQPGAPPSAPRALEPLSHPPPGATTMQTQSSAELSAPPDTAALQQPSTQSPTSSATASRALPDLPTAGIADVPRLDQAQRHTIQSPAVQHAPSIPASSYQHQPRPTSDPVAPVPASGQPMPAQPSVTPTLGPIPSLRRLDGLTLGALPARKPIPVVPAPAPLSESGRAQTQNPTSDSTAASRIGAMSFNSIDSKPIPPTSDPAVRSAAAAQFGTPLVSNPPLPNARQVATTRPGQSGQTSALDDLVRTIGTLTQDPQATAIDQPRSQRVELDFYAMLPEVVAAIDDVRRPLDRIGVEIGPHGQPTWSARNVAYGTLQRIEMTGSVLAWLICEMDHRGALLVRVVPERQDDVALTGAARRERGPFQRADIANAAAEALKPLAAYAAIVVPRRGQALSAAQSVHESQWQGTEPTAREALATANEALASIGAQLVQMGQPAFDSATLRMRWPVSVEVGGAIVAIMHVERSEDWLDVAIAPSDTQRADLARRARTVASAVTAQSLAEVMAEAAWPVIVDARAGAN